MTLQESIAINKVDYAALNEIAAGYVLRDEAVPVHISQQLKELRSIITSSKILITKLA